MVLFIITYKSEDKTAAIYNFVNFLFMTYRKHYKCNCFNIIKHLNFYNYNIATFGKYIG